jgi:CBS domain-containing protein
MSTPTVSSVMTRTIARITPAATLLEVARKLAAVEVGALVVGTVDHAEAIISERDVTNAIGRGGDPSELRAADMANDALLWCDPDASIDEATRIMADNAVRHLLVRGGEGEPAGIVSARDLLYAYAR